MFSFIYNCMECALIAHSDTLIMAIIEAFSISLKIKTEETSGFTTTNLTMQCLHALQVS